MRKPRGPHRTWHAFMAGVRTRMPGAGRRKRHAHGQGPGSGRWSGWGTVGLMPDPLDNYALALAGHALGYSFVPCAPGTKVPIVRWRVFQETRPDPALYERWFKGTRNNIALLTSGLVLFDCDDPAKADLVLAQCGDTPHKVRTPRGGIHLGYRRDPADEVRNWVKVLGEPIDIRTNGGLEVIPSSRTEHGAYAWLGEGLSPVSDLPVARVDWTRGRTRTRTHVAIDGPGVWPTEKGSIRFPEAYCLRIESVQGQNGSRGLVRVVSILRDAGRSPDQIFAFVKGVWGPACCRPEWSDREIWHCIDRHCRPR